MPTTRDIPPLSSLKRTFGQAVSRLDHYCQARFRNRFGPTVAFLSRFIPSGGVILDVGANHGKFAKNFARLHDGSCSVHCFEPLEYNYSLLDRIVRPYRNVRVHRVALSDRAGQADLFIPVKKSLHLLPGSAHLGVDAAADRFGTSTAPDVYRETINTDTLDAVLARERVDRLDFMKIDVEGAEALVLQGGLHSLRRHRPAIFCELTRGLPEHLGMKVEDSLSLLRELGYEMFIPDVKAGRAEPCREYRVEWRDYLFLHPHRASVTTGSA
jgi:FkbM family methyltransferase